MSIDFTGITGVSDDYGVVTQIADESGRVIWSAVKKAKVKLVATPYSSGDPIKASVQVGGEVYDLSIRVSNVAVSGTVWEGELPVGAEILIENKSSRIVYAYINHPDGTQTKVSFGGSFGPFTYTVVGNANIEVKGIYTSTGPSSYASDIPEIYITEIPEGHALVNITGRGNATYCYATINGTKYTTATTLVLPVGTVVTCTAKDKDDDYSAVFLNGQIVAGRSSNAVYDYSVTRDVEIKLNTSPSAQYEQEIHITEQ